MQESANLSENASRRGAATAVGATLAGVAAPTLDRDRLLIASIATGKEAALEEIDLRYRRRITCFARRITGSSDLAEDIACDALCIIWQGAAGFKGQSKVSTWIFGITYRLSVKTLQSRGRETHHAQTFSDLGEPTHEPWSAAEDREWVQIALAGLPEYQRTALELFYHFGHSCEEIAHRMKCPVNTVKTRMFYGRRSLHRLLVDLAGDSATTNSCRSVSGREMQAATH
jgi:RNA polymerase sigma-70 factor (ECF subfamily)